MTVAFGVKNPPSQNVFRRIFQKYLLLVWPVSKYFLLNVTYFLCNLFSKYRPHGFHLLEDAIGLNRVHTKTQTLLAKFHPQLVHAPHEGTQWLFTS
jgi:hypothetical protein